MNEQQILEVARNLLCAKLNNSLQQESLSQGAYDVSIFSLGSQEIYAAFSKDNHAYVVHFYLGSFYIQVDPQ